MSSSVSRKGSYCRYSGRAMVQKRLLSVNPAEPKMTRWTLASCANVGVGVANRVEANTTRSTSPNGAHTDHRVLINIERLMRHLPRFYLLAMRKGDREPHVPHTCSPAMAFASQQRHITSLPQKRLSEEPCAATLCIQPINTISALYSRCHVPLRDNHVCAICYTKCLMCQLCTHFCHCCGVLVVLSRLMADSSDSCPLPHRAGKAQLWHALYRQEGCIVLCC